MILKKIHPARRLVHHTGAFFMLLCLAVSCGPAGDEPPAGILSEKQMAQVLVDFHVARSLWQAESFPEGQAELFTDGQEGNKAMYYQEVLDRHGITAESFRESMSYYTRHPGILTQIYDRVIEELSRKQAEVAAG